MRGGGINDRTAKAKARRVSCEFRLNRLMSFLDGEVLVYDTRYHTRKYIF